MNNTNVYHVSNNNFPESLVMVLAMILDKISRCSADGRTVGEDKICLSGIWSEKSLINLKRFIEGQVIDHVGQNDAKYVRVDYKESATDIEMPTEENGSGRIKEFVDVFMTVIAIQWTAG